MGSILDRIRENEEEAFRNRKKAIEKYEESLRSLGCDDTQYTAENFDQRAPLTSGGIAPLLDQYRWFEGDVTFLIDKNTDPEFKWIEEEIKQTSDRLSNLLRVRARMLMSKAAMTTSK